MTARRFALVALTLLAALYAAWSLHAGQPAAVVALLTALPAVCALSIARRRPQAPLVAGLLALLWFCHGVMAAWSSAGDRPYALAVALLAVGVVLAASVPGLRARSARRRAARDL